MKLFAKTRLNQHSLSFALQLSIYSCLLVPLLIPKMSFGQSLESASNSVDAVEMNVPKTLSRTQLSRRLRKILADGEKLTVTQVTEGMLKLIVQDLSYLKVKLINPMVIRGVIPKAPLSATMASWAESRLSSLIHQESSIMLRECISCKRQVTKVDEQRFVFTYGNLQNNENSSVNTDTKFQSALDITLTWSASRMIMIAHARLLSAQGELLWNESYRSGDFGALAKRGIGNQKDETSIAKYQKLATIPDDQFLDLKEIDFGVALRSGQGSTNNVLAKVGAGYGVFFGGQDQYLLMLKGMMSFNNLFFTDVKLEFRRRLSELSTSTMVATPSIKQRAMLASQGLWLKAMLGIPFSPFITGKSFGFGLLYMTPYRIGIAGNMLYAFEFDEREDPAPGGFGADLNLVINF